MELRTPKTLARLVDRYLDPSKTWSESRDKKMRQGLRENEGARAYYNERVVGHRLLVGADPAHPSGFESERLLTSLLDGAAPERSASRASMWIRISPLLAGAAALFIFLQPPSDTTGSIPNVTQSAETPHAEYLGARGVQAADIPAGLGIEGVPIAGGVGYEVVNSAGIWIGDALRLRTLNTDPRLAYLFVFAMQAKGECLWYAPLPAEGQSLPIQQGKRALFDIVDLKGSHDPGALRVFAIFSETPLAVDKVKSTFENNLAYLQPDTERVAAQIKEALGLNPGVAIVSINDTVILQDSLRAGK